MLIVSILKINVKIKECDYCTSKITNSVRSCKEKDEGSSYKWSNIIPKPNVVLSVFQQTKLCNQPKNSGFVTYIICSNNFFIFLHEVLIKTRITSNERAFHF
jgi:hypothetical protein